MCAAVHGAPLRTATADEAPITPTSRPASIKEDPRYKAWTRAVAWGLVLLLVLSTACGAIVVFSRRYQKLLEPREKKPTPSDDVWAMHRFPESLEPDEGSPDEIEPEEGDDEDESEEDWK